MFADTSVSERRGPIGGDRLDTPVREIMRPGVIVLADDASVHQAQRALVAHGVHAVLVLERGSGRAVGWVTSRGLLPWLERDTALAHARGAVTEPPVLIDPSATAREALEMLAAEDVARLLVTRHADSLPEGVLADVDLLRLVAG
jgi:CBS domain-containing protein